MPSAAKAPVGVASAETRAWIVVGITGGMMVIEIVGGLLLGSMALVADGLHMATHAAALMVGALAYRYARRHARDPRYALGTGKVGDLAGFASAVVLAVTAVLIAGESVLRLNHPHFISLDAAIAVAVAGLAVNLMCAWILRHDHQHGHHHGHHHGTGDHHHGHDHHGHDHDHGHAHDHAHSHSQGHHGPAHLHANSRRQKDLQGTAHPHPHPHPHPHLHPHPHAPAATSVAGPADRDHNQHGMYLHVLADSLTSVLAILALVLGREFGWLWLDPAIGVVGGAVIAVWSVQLIRASGRVLLDRQDSAGPLSDRIRHLIEGPGTRIADLRIWRIGPAQRAVVIVVECRSPASSDALRGRLAGIDGIAFLRIEVTGPQSPRLQ